MVVISLAWWFLVVSGWHHFNLVPFQGSTRWRSASHLGSLQRIWRSTKWPTRRCCEKIGRWWWMHHCTPEQSQAEHTRATFQPWNVVLDILDCLGMSAFIFPGGGDNIGWCLQPVFCSTHSMQVRCHWCERCLFQKAKKELTLVKYNQLKQDGWSWQVGIKLAHFSSGPLTFGCIRTLANGDGFRNLTIFRSLVPQDDTSKQRSQEEIMLLNRKGQRRSENPLRMEDEKLRYPTESQRKSQKIGLEDYQIESVASCWESTEFEVRHTGNHPLLPNYYSLATYQLLKQYREVAWSQVLNRME